MDEQRFDYHYGNEAEQYSFCRISKLLIVDDRFKILYTDAKLLYGLILDRISLSMKSGWLDDENRVFIYFPMDEIMEQLNCQHGKAVKLLAELDDARGIGLICRVKQGQGRPAKIYVMKAATLSSPDFPKSERNNTEINNTDFSETDLSIHPSRSMADSINVDGLRKTVKENIEYDIQNYL